MTGRTNMPHCRWENTADALNECLDAQLDMSMRDVRELSPSEARGYNRVVNLARAILSQDEAIREHEQ